MAPGDSSTGRECSSATFDSGAKADTCRSTLTERRARSAASPAVRPGGFCAADQARERTFPSAVARSRVQIPQRELAARRRLGIVRGNRQRGVDHLLRLHPGERGQAGETAVRLRVCRSQDIRGRRRSDVRARLPAPALRGHGDLPGGSGWDDDLDWVALGEFSRRGALSPDRRAVRGDDRGRLPSWGRTAASWAVSAPPRTLP